MQNSDSPSVKRLPKPEAELGQHKESRIWGVNERLRKDQLPAVIAMSEESRSSYQTDDVRGLVDRESV